MTPTPPGPLSRRGPRPLLLHLMLVALRQTALPAALLATTSSSASSTGSTRSNGASWRWRSEQACLQAADLARRLDAAGHAPSDLAGPVLRALAAEDRALIAGIAAYRRHPWRRTLADPPVLWSEGGTRLLDYGATAALSPGATILLVVPSLVNRAHILDLMDGASMLRWLAAQGIRPLLLDWGWPGPTERAFTLTDYIAGRLERALTVATREAGGPVLLAGYCMGGTLALAAAHRRPDLVRGLALLATPWDFHAGEPDRARVLAALLPLFEPAMAFADTLPIDLLQTLFALLDPFGVTSKYRAFARLDPAGARARLFVALEDWLNDGVPLPAPVARECLAGWYGRNEPAQMRWRVAGLPVDPRAVAVPAFLAIPARDRIVPPDSSRPLASLLPRAEVLEPTAGHIGMAAGSGAEAALWRPLAAWVAGVGR
ncbi:MAG: alpha/beta fold hydrolase [Acetobacteraceae bacterium]